MSSDLSEAPSARNRTSKSFQGVIIPMVTPATDEGKGDVDSILRLVEFFIQARVDPFVFGTTGEASSISLNEKIRLAGEFCPALKDRTTIYMGISSNCFSDSLQMAESFAEQGAHVTVANLPSYYTLSQDQMFSYFEQLADSVPLPLIVYNIPSTTRMSISLEVIERLSHHPNIVGIKDSERDEARMEKSIAQYRDREDFSHFMGWAVQSKKALLLGSDGLVPSSGNVIPHLYRQLYDAVLVGDEALATKLQDQTDAFSKLYQRDWLLGESLAALKVLANEAGLCGTAMFPPFMQLPEEIDRDLRNQVATFLTA